MTRFYKGFLGSKLNLFLVDDDEEDTLFYRRYAASYFYKNRFKSAAYLKQIAEVKYTPQVMFKVISKGCGRGSLTNLMCYIARERACDSEEERLTLIDDMQNHIDGKAEISNNAKLFSASFSSQFEIDAVKKAEEYEEAISQFRKEREVRLPCSNEEFNNVYRLHNEVQSYKMKEDLKTHKIKRKKDPFYTSKEEEKLKEDYKKIPLREKHYKNFTEPNQEKDFTHIMLSHGGKNLNLRKAKESVKNFLEKEFGEKGYRYMYVMHTDKNNPHFHVILMNRNIYNPKLPPIQFNKQDLYILRQRFVQESDKMGIKRVSTLKMDTASQLKRMHDETISLSNKASIYQHRLAKDSRYDFDAFDHRKKMIEQANRIKERSISLSQKANISTGYRSKYKPIHVLSAVKKVEKDLKKATDENFTQVLQTSINSFNKDYKAIANIIQNEFTPPTKKAYTDKYRSERIKLAKKLEIARQKSIKTALEEIKKAYKNTKNLTRMKVIKEHFDILKQEADKDPFEKKQAIQQEQSVKIKI